MTTLTGEEIGYLIVKNGVWGPGGDKEKIIAFLDTAIAVALAESGGVTDRIGGPNKDGSKDYGLYQINGKAHADLFQKYAWANPVDNIEMARTVWTDAGRSFSPWAAYNNGSYKSHLGWGKKVYDKAMAAKASGNDSGWSIGNIPGNLWKGVTNITDFGGDAAKAVVKGPAAIVAGALKDVLTWVAKGALVVGATLLALLLLGLGVWLLISNTKAGKEVKGAATDAALAVATKGAV